jgi:hypothetical protein
LHHGTVSNDANQLHKRRGQKAPQAEEYPQHWIPPYVHSEAPFYESLEHKSGEHANTRRMLDVFSAAVPERYADTILKNWQEKERLAS